MDTQNKIDIARQVIESKGWNNTIELAEKIVSELDAFNEGEIIKSEKGLLDAVSKLFYTPPGNLPNGLARQRLLDFGRMIKIRADVMRHEARLQYRRGKYDKAFILKIREKELRMIEKDITNYL